MGSLFLVRHATTAASASGRNLGQRDDPPLADPGVGLARSLARTVVAELAELPHDDGRIVVSPARRCRQTAAPIAAETRLGAGRVEAAPGLLEIDYGDWDGLTAEECRARDPELRAAWEADPWSTRCPDGESGADVAARAFGVLDEVEAWAAADRARWAVVVTHNHVIRLRLCHLLGWPMREYRDRVSADPGAYSLLTLGSDRVIVRRLNAPGA